MDTPIVVLEAALDALVQLRGTLTKLHRQLGGKRRKTLSAFDSLTRREREVVEWIAVGCTVKQVARQLGIAERTANNHLHHVYEKLDVGSRVELMLKIAQDAPQWLKGA